MNPYQPPAARHAAGSASVARVGVARLRAIARSHRLINLAILAQFGVLFHAVAGPAALGHAAAELTVILTAVIIVIGIFSFGCAAWLAYSLGGVLVAVLCAALMTFPVVNIVTLIVMSRIATARLRKAGYEVGLLGADPDAIGR